jgi:hypothetical protein
MFYFFLTYSYRSYLSFGRTVGDYWPRHSADTPPIQKQILDMLGEKNAGVLIAIIHFPWGGRLPDGR